MSIERTPNILDQANEFVIKVEDDWIYDTYLEHKREKRRAGICRCYSCVKGFKKLDGVLSDEAVRLRVPERDHEQQRDRDAAMAILKGLKRENGHKQTDQEQSDQDWEDFENRMGNGT